MIAFRQIMISLGGEMPKTPDFAIDPCLRKKLGGVLPADFFLISPSPSSPSFHSRLFELAANKVHICKQARKQVRKAIFL